MTKITNYTIVFCMVAGLLVVWTLHHHSKKLSGATYNFTRTLKPVELIPSNALDIRFNSYYIAGASGGYIYFGNYMAPLHALRIDTATSDTAFIAINIQHAELLTRSVKLNVIDSLFYLIDGGMPAIFRGKVGDWAGRRFMFDSVYFTRAIPVTPASFAFLALGKAKENVLGSLSPGKPHVSIFEKHLEKQVDGVFCTDGDLIYNKEYVIFLYKYRNEYLVLGHDMKMIKKAKTIDPIHRVKIKPHRLSSDGSLTLANPGGVVNEKGVVNSGLLYIHSRIRAINDEESQFRNSAVIDVYDLDGTDYLWSFYLPDYRGKRLRDFLVQANMIVAVYEHHVVLYRFQQKEHQGAAREATDPPS